MDNNRLETITYNLLITWLDSLYSIPTKEYVMETLEITAEELEQLNFDKIIKMYE